MTRTGLLSIHREYADAIFAGTKQFEFRRRAPDIELPTRFLVYVSGRRRLVGEILVDEILSMAPSQLWEHTKHAAGISRAKFRAYFAGRSVAHAFRIHSVTEFRVQASLESLRSSVPGGFYPPQYLQWLTPDRTHAIQRAV